jgi:hypothetical protein
MPRSPSSVLSQRGSNESGGAPVGIKIYCVLGAVALAGLAIAVPMTVLSGPLGIPLGLGLAAFGIVYAVVLVGLWNVASWAWIAATALQALGVLANLVAVRVVGLLVGLLVLGYFLHVRDAYLS